MSARRKLLLAVAICLGALTACAVAVGVWRALVRGPSGGQYGDGDASEVERRRALFALEHGLHGAPRVVLGDAATADMDRARERCAPAEGVPAERCGFYHANAYWLPRAFVDNMTCACEQLPETPTGACVRGFLQDRLARETPNVIDQAAEKKPLDDFLMHPFEYEEYYVRFVHQALTPLFYQDLVDAYAVCCCPASPASYAAFQDFVVAPIEHCGKVSDFIDRLGSCHDTPGEF